MKNIALGVLLLAVGVGVLGLIPNHAQPPVPPRPIVTHEQVVNRPADDPGITCEQLHRIIHDLGKDDGAPGPCYIHRWE